MTLERHLQTKEHESPAIVRGIKEFVVPVGAAGKAALHHANEGLAAALFEGELDERQLVFPGKRFSGFPVDDFGFAFRAGPQDKKTFPPLPGVTLASSGNHFTSSAGSVRAFQTSCTGAPTRISFFDAAFILGF
jgi:hypothetical protein